MRIYKHLITFLLVAGLCQIVEGQSMKAWLNKAAEAYEARNYSSALAYYQIILEEEGDRIDALYYAAESARYLRSYRLSEEYYSKIPMAHRQGTYVQTDFWLGIVKKSLEKFDEAIELFERVAEKHKDDIELSQRAIEEIENCHWAREAIAKPSKVEVFQMDETTNSYFSDYAPFKVGDTMYYTSTAEVKVDTRKKKKKKKRRKKKRKKNDKKVEVMLVTKIFRSIGGEKGKPIRQNSRTENTFTANFSMNTTGSRMYYTICTQVPKKEDYVCALYYREREPGRDWGRARALPETINLPGFSSTQPSIGWDAKTESEYLYYASDCPGGEGKMDIWYSKIDSDGNFSMPTNLAEVNTYADELTPYFDGVTQTLFFASDGFQNVGGFDIFKTEKTDRNWLHPENLGHPVNTSFDELYYYIDHETGKSYIASNRPGSFCISPDKDCNLHDIYEITNHVGLMTSAFNEKDFSMLYGATIEVTDLATGAKETFQMNDEEFKYSLPLFPGRKYRIAVSKDGFETGYAEINSKEIENDPSAKKYVFLTPMTQMLVRTFDAKTRRPLNGMSLRITDLSTMKESNYQIPSDNFEMSIPINTSKEYRVVGIKSGFDAISMDFHFDGLEDQEVITRDLFIQPFFGGLPITLYFDNDEPSLEASADMTFRDTYENYMMRKGDFIDENAIGLEGIDVELAKMAAERFFDDEIQSGYYDLLKLSDNLLFALRRGESIELTLEGYTSPIADDHYNEKLAGRRIETLIKHFETYRNGALKPYIGQELIINKVPYGERTVTVGVSDDSKDRRSSVFSPVASKERKVIIAGFKAPPAEKIIMK